MNDAAGPRSGREPQSATFDLARVGRARRGRQPAVLVGFVAILAAVMAIGVGGRTPPAATQAPLAAAASPAVPAPTPTAATPTATPGPRPTRAVIVAGSGGPLVLQIRRPAASIFVHGDVFAPRVTWVFISLQDAFGDVKGFASVSVPGSAVPGTINGPSLRFDIDVAIPPDLVDQSVWIQAIAYDAAGAVVGTTRIGIRADGGPVAVKG